MKKILTIPILLFLTFLGFVYFLYPTYLHYSQLKKEVIERDKYLQQKQIYFTNLAQTKLKLKEYKESLDKIDQALPPSLCLGCMIDFFQKQASNNGLVLEDISLKVGKAQQKEQKEEKIQNFYFSLHLVGDVTSFSEFLKNLEKSARLVEVENFSFKLPRGKKLPEFELEVKVRTYLE